LIDWSSTNNLAVALDSDMYIWNAISGEIAQLFSMGDTTDDYICSTSWIQHKGNVLAIGNSKNIVEIWDVNKKVPIRQMKSHTSRVGSLSWNEHILTSGSRDGSIHHHDVRVAKHHVATLKLHDQEVCGLRWSPDGRHLASGANDNIVGVWDSNMIHDSQPLHSFREHSSAVKALAWCPWQSNILASGGGTNDGHIRMWNIYSGAMVQATDTSSQISSILWSKHFKELISSHGYEKNQLTIWKYSDMSRVTELTGHTNRILSMTMSPDQEMVASIGADETLRLWRCFGLDEKERAKQLSDKKNTSQISFTRCIR
jgi:cell division cycle 20, cofactor of APC complex